MAAEPPTSTDRINRPLDERQLKEALNQVKRRVQGSRACQPAHGLLAQLLVRLGRVAEAETVVLDALALEGGPADAYDGLAFVSMMLGEHERANQLYRRATDLAPRDPRFWYNLACSERSFGRLIEAEAACDRAIAIDPAQYPSHLLRSELRVQTRGANHIPELETLLSKRRDDYRARVFLGYALGKELDDVERYDEAFDRFAAAARARRERLDYDVAVDERKLQRIAEVYDATRMHDALHRSAAATESSREPRFIFIVGLPRSGTTLLERILTALSGVRSNGETDHFSQALLGASRGDGDVFARAAQADPTGIAAEYTRLARGGPQARAIIDKLPLNYLYAGAIRRALPQARILLVRRDPLDSCFAMYRTLFAGGYPFSYDLVDLGRYYAAYERLIDHWRSSMGGELHEIHYHELVQYPKRVGAAVAAHCGLSWSDQAVEIQHNQSVSLTASASQVRRPIYGSSSGRWRLYERHLGPLISTLQEQSVRLPGSR
jgi:tetratricopeptide (TPR) repeat protein